MSWFSWNKSDDEATDTVARLEQTVRAQMTSADDATVRIVAAVAGLLAGVAYSDREFADPEAEMIRATLARIQGMGRSGAEAVLALLREVAAEATTVYTYRFTRTLKDEMGREGRLEILDLLVDLSAADGKILTSETNFMRQVATGMGLTQDDYNASQSRHRDKLAVLDDKLVK